MAFKISRYHDISTGHRVHGHESKCAHLHGHNYRIHFHCQSTQLDSVGRVVDFSVVKLKLCEWVEKHWDHKMLIWKNDPMLNDLIRLDPEGVVSVPFNPTAEQMAQYLVRVVGPDVLRNTNVTLVSVNIEETRKCSASFEK